MPINYIPSYAFAHISYSSKCSISLCHAQLFFLKKFYFLIFYMYFICLPLTFNPTTSLLQPVFFTPWETQLFILHLHPP